MHGAKRVWLYGFVYRDISANTYFRDIGWRQSFRAIGGVLRLDLYSAPKAP
jgi:hypothetical protein